ncbi:MAG: caspase domain-containing protein, partial [Alphaproteobacteria bacterium]
VALTLAAAAAHAAWAQSERRVALVIGNSAYRNVRSLEKTLNDARAVARTLREVGFAVIERENLDRRGMNEALTEFVDRISGGGVGLFYYAGHGVQIGGSNYLIPVDAPALGNAEELRDDAIDLGRVLERLTEAKAKLDIVILDACRDNPFPQVAGRSLGGTQGLAIPAAPNGILIVYSAGVNQIALDTLGPSDSNPNGLFTRDLLPLITEPGLRLDEAVRRIRREVSAAARSIGREQNPAIYDQTDGDFYFVPPKTAPAASPVQGNLVPRVPPAANAAAPATGPVDKDALFWQSIKDSTNSTDFEFYLKQFPNGTFAELAKERVAQLGAVPRLKADHETRVAYVGELDNVGGAAAQQIKSDGYDFYATMPDRGNFGFEGGGNRLTKLPGYVAGIVAAPGTYTFSDSKFSLVSNPSNPGQLVRAGFIAAHAAPGTTVALVDVTLAAGVPDSFYVGFVTNINARWPEDYPNSITMAVGLARMTAQTSQGAIANGDIDIFFFEISGARAGEHIVIGASQSVANRSGGRFNPSISGLLFSATNPLSRN